MARGRGITLQIEDEALTLSSWNKPAHPEQPGRNHSPTLVRRPGANFQLAVNFQNSGSHRQLVTPASLMSAPQLVNRDVDMPDDNHDEFDDIEDSFEDSDDDFENSHYPAASHNYQYFIPDGTEGHITSSEEEPTNGNRDEVEVAIGCMKEIERKEFGYVHLEESGTAESHGSTAIQENNVDDVTGAVLRDRDVISPSSDKENLEELRDKENIGAESYSSPSSEQKGTWYKKDSLIKDETKPKKTKNKQPLSERGNKSKTSPQSATRAKLELSKMGKSESNVGQEIAVQDSKRHECQKETPSKVPSDKTLGYVSPSESEIKFCGGSKLSHEVGAKQMADENETVSNSQMKVKQSLGYVPPQEAEIKFCRGPQKHLSPMAKPFVPRSSPDQVRCHPWIGLDDKPVPWSAGYNFQQQHTNPYEQVGFPSESAKNMPLTKETRQANTTSPVLGFSAPRNDHSSELEAPTAASMDQRRHVASSSRVRTEELGTQCLVSSASGSNELTSRKARGQNASIGQMHYSSAVDTFEGHASPEPRDNPYNVKHPNLRDNPVHFSSKNGPGSNLSLSIKESLVQNAGIGQMHYSSAVTTSQGYECPDSRGNPYNAMALDTRDNLVHLSSKMGPGGNSPNFSNGLSSKKSPAQNAGMGRQIHESSTRTQGYESPDSRDNPYNVMPPNWARGNLVHLSSKKRPDCNSPPNFNKGLSSKKTPVQNAGIGQIHCSSVSTSQEYESPDSRGNPYNVMKSHPSHELAHSSSKLGPEANSPYLRMDLTAVGSNSRPDVVDEQSQERKLARAVGASPIPPDVPSLSEIIEHKKRMNVSEGKRAISKGGPPNSSTGKKGKDANDSSKTSSTSSTSRKTVGGLSAAEEENEYAWRKYRLVSKVQRVLKKPLDVDTAQQLKDIMVKAHQSLSIFQNRPKEVAITIEEIIMCAAKDQGYIDALHDLSGITENFDRELEMVLKQVEWQFIQPFIGEHIETTGDHLEETALNYCCFLGHLYKRFVDADTAALKMLDQYLSSLAYRWIMLPNEGNNSERVEESSIKCLRALMSELGPSFREWTAITDVIQKEVLGSRSQSVRKLFLEILLKPESVTTKNVPIQLDANASMEPTSDVQRNVSTKDLTSKTSGPPKEEMDQPPSSKVSASAESQVTTKSSKQCSSDKVEGETKAAPVDTSPYLSPYNDSMKATYLSAKLTSPPLGKETEKKQPGDRQMNGSRIAETGSNEIEARPSQGEGFDWWDLEATSSKQVVKSPQKETIKVENLPKSVPSSADGDVPKANNGPGLANKVKPKSHGNLYSNNLEKSAGKDASVLASPPGMNGDLLPNDTRVSSDNSLPNEIREPTMNEGSSVPDNRGNPPINTGGSQEIPPSESQEVWDEELLVDPPSIPLFTAPKRPVDGTSLRYQREHYAMNIGQAARTYEVCIGSSGENSEGQITGDPSRNEQDIIVQADDDVEILEETSDSDDSEGEDDIPLIWGEVTPGESAHSKDIKTTQQVVQQSHPVPVDQQTAYAQAPWNHPQRLLVFKELEDNEPHLSGVEILAQQKLQSRRLFGRPVAWNIPDNLPVEESEID